MATFDTGELAADAIANDVNAYVVKLTGRFQRPKPVKVERSEKITLWPGKWSVEGIINSELPLRGVIHWQE